MNASPLAPPVRALLRRLLVVPALALALFGEQQAAGARALHLEAPPSTSWLAFLAAAVLFALAAGEGRVLTAGIAQAMWATARTLPQRRLFAALLAASGLCALAAAPLFAILNTTPVADYGTGNDLGPPVAEPANTGAWLLWIAALLLFGAAWVVWERSVGAPAEGATGDSPGDSLPRVVEWLLPAGLFGVAALLRFTDLESVPPGLWFDEAQNGIVAQQLLAPGAPHPTFVGNFTQMGTLPLYLLGLGLQVFGTTVWPLRLLAALSGSLIVPMIYLLAARLYGWRVGLAAAGLLAVSSWNLTFSRLGVISLFTVALDVGVYLCLAQGLRTGRLGYYAGGGVLLGLGLQTYYVARLVPFVLLALLVHQLLATRGRMLRNIQSGLLVFAVGSVIAFLPVGLLALQQPAAFGGRVNDVSVFNPEASGGDPQAFSHSLTKHLLMFNFAGDNNGRHNLPGAPMLDDLTAALFFTGLGACAWRVRRWQYFFPLAWFAAALAGGVLSLPAEAPQAHRTLENSIVTALLAGIVLGEGWQVVTGARRAQRAPADRNPVGAPSSWTADIQRRLQRGRVRTTLPTRRAAQHAPGTAAPNTTLPMRGKDTAAQVPAPAARAGVPVLPEMQAAAPPSRARWLTWGVSLAGIAGAIGLAAGMSIPHYFGVQAS
ncbi:MAG TPA: glycosyltransferase family 39 protein, partial [Chloroflexia bacterium]|nr:glycosyltransferase family 39 protein [Chloroflexia bacterium]